VIRSGRRLKTAEAPTAAAPKGPSSTTAASVAAELADQSERLMTVGAGAASQATNSRANAVQIPHHACIASPMPDDTLNGSGAPSSRRARTTASHHNGGSARTDIRTGTTYR
jgi:hypothetical protein